MDDASFSQDPMAGADQNVMPEDPNAMPEGPNAEPNTMPEDPNAMPESPNADGETSDDTVSIINQLNDEDKEAVRSYAESMLNKNGGKDENGGQEDVQASMMEEVIFTKKQLNKIQENFGPSQDELMKKDNKKELPKKQTQIKNSPFTPPRFS